MVLNEINDIRDVCKEIGVENYRLFSGIMMMRSFDMNVAVSTKMSKKDLELFQEGMKTQSSLLADVLKALPRPLLLVLRNNNLIRMINLELGTPVNRFVIMAREANLNYFDILEKRRRRGKRNTPLIHSSMSVMSASEIGIFDTIRWNFKLWWETFRFEMKIKEAEWSLWVAGWYITFMIFFGFMKPLSLEPTIDAA